MSIAPDLDTPEGRWASIPEDIRQAYVDSSIPDETRRLLGALVTLRRFRDLAADAVSLPHLDREQARELHTAVTHYKDRSSHLVQEIEDILGAYL